VPRTHLRPTAPIAPQALLPEDPAQALALAQELLTRPVMSNHTLGLWGYHGITADGEEVTIQATGLGGAAAAIVLAELAAHGTTHAIRLGTCEAPGPAPAQGSLLVAERVLACDGVSASLGGPPEPLPDPGLTAALRRSLEPAVIATLDVPRPEAAPAEAAAFDLATAPLVAQGAAAGVAVASCLVVAAAAGVAAGDQELEEAGLELGRSAAAALRSAATSPAS
jgi:hypothetical protein